MTLEAAPLPTTGSDDSSSSTPGSVRLCLPFLGEVDLPRDELLFLGGIAVLATVGVLEWPITLIVGVGHLLAASRHHRLIQKLGKVLEEA